MWCVLCDWVPSVGICLGSLQYIDPLSGYWVLLDDDPETLSLFDAIPIGEDLAYNLISGWNLMSYPSTESRAVGLAIPDDVEDEFIGMIGEGESIARGIVFNFIPCKEFICIE